MDFFKEIRVPPRPDFWILKETPSVNVSIRLDGIAIKFLIWHTYSFLSANAKHPSSRICNISITDEFSGGCPVTYGWGHWRVRVADLPASDSTAYFGDRERIYCLDFMLVLISNSMPVS